MHEITQEMNTGHFLPLLCIRRVVIQYIYIYYSKSNKGNILIRICDVYNYFFKRQ